MNEIVKSESYIAPVVNVNSALERYQAMKDFIEGILKKDTDFGIIPGTGTKPVLLKPGAEKLGAFFGLRPRFILSEKVDDWTGKDHNNEMFFYRDYKCQLYRGDELIGEGCGSCNSWETKYRYRKSARVCPECGKETIIKGREEYGGGWICFAKKGGCGTKFKDGDQSIEAQETGTSVNKDVADQVNTIDKMAQKRAFIAAILIATNASDYFTQDLEDFVKHPEVIDGEFKETVEQFAKETGAKVAEVKIVDKTDNQARNKALYEMKKLAATKGLDSQQTNEILASCGDDPFAAIERVKEL